MWKTIVPNLNIPYSVQIFNMYDAHAFVQMVYTLVGSVST